MISDKKRGRHWGFIVPMPAFSVRYLQKEESALSLFCLDSYFVIEGQILQIMDKWPKIG